MKNPYNSLMVASLNVSEVCLSIKNNGVDYLDPVNQKTNTQLLTEHCGSVLAAIGDLQEAKVLDSIALCIAELKA